MYLYSLLSLFLVFLSTFYLMIKRERESVCVCMCVCTELENVPLVLPCTLSFCSPVHSVSFVKS